MPRASALIPLAVALLACGEADSKSESRVTRTTGTAVDTVVLHGPLQSLPELVAADTLTLTGAAEDLFASNPQAVFPLRDGRTILTEGREYAVFGADGQLAGRFTRQGQGPGELAYLSALWQDDADSIWTVDPGTRRVSVFAPDLSFARSFQIPNWGDESGISLWAGLGRDTLAALRFEYAPFSMPPGRATTMLDIGTWVVGADSVNLPLRRASGEVEALAPGILPEPIVSTPFGGSQSWRPVGRCMVYGFSSEWALTLDAPGPDGALRTVGRVVAPDVKPVPVDAERKEAYIEGITRQIRNDAFRTAYDKALREHITFAPNIPVFGRILTARDGAIWIQDYRGTGTGRPDAWTVLDAANLRAWRLNVLARSRLLAVDSARAFIATANEDDVETHHWWILPELAGITPPAECRPSAGR
jgi:hypothetical protein